MTKISLIAAMGENRELGKNNDLIFRISEDLKRLKALTLHHPIIMGRKTYESIGRVLPHRTNIIITRDKKYTVEGGVVCNSLDEAIEIAKKSEGGDEIFIFGGGQIFEQALSLVEKLYLTVVKGTYDADVYFPDYSEFTKVIEKEDRSSDGYSYSFITLER